jgi:DNA topoisomerase VI subunit B
MAAVATLERTTFRTSRLLEFCSRKELVAQTGHEPDAWPLVVLKELVDNALDACEEAGVAPEIGFQVEPEAITVVDNGPGMPPDTVTDILDFSNRVSSREAYVAPDRGAQGNALKTILAMPFVLDGAVGRVEICAHGRCHRIAFTVDALRQAPVIDHRYEQCDVRTGTSITVAWPESAGSILAGAEQRFLQIADDYTWLNPHLALTLTWFGERYVASRLQSAIHEAQRHAAEAPVPDDLATMVAAGLGSDPSQAWDEVVQRLAAQPASPDEA